MLHKCEIIFVVRKETEIISDNVRRGDQRRLFYGKKLISQSICQQILFFKL